MSRDPLGEEGGINVCVFAGNNAIASWDYLGLFAASKEDLFLEYMVEAGARLHSGGFRFQAENPTLPAGVREDEYTLDTSQTRLGRVVGEYLAHPDRYGFSCGRTMSLVFYAAIVKFYRGCCDVVTSRDYSGIVEFTSISDLAQ